MRVFAIITPLPAANPSALMTMGRPLFFTYSMAGAVVVKTS